MASAPSKSRPWRLPNGEVFAVGAFVGLNANSAELRLEDGGTMDIPLAILHEDDLDLILAPKEAISLGLGALSSPTELNDKSPPTINVGALLSFAKSPDPVLWPANQFYNSVKNLTSGLNPLLNARVTHATSYHEPGAVGHDYVVVRINTGIPGEANQFWLRCQRTPVAHSRGANIPALYKLLNANRKIPAADGVKVSLDEFKLRNISDTRILASSCENVQVKHLLSLLETIHSVSPSYDLLSCNSWWFSDVIIRMLHRLGENWDNRVKRSMWRIMTMALGSGAAKSTHEVAKRFLEQWKPAIDVGIDTSTKPPLTSRTSHATTSEPDTTEYTKLSDVDSMIPGSSTNIIDTIVSTVQSLGVMECPVATLCGLIQSNPHSGKGRIHSLVRRRRTAGVRHEFLLLGVNGPNMWIRLERAAKARVGPFSKSKLSSDFRTNDTSRVSELESRLLVEDVSQIVAIVQFRAPPTLDHLRRLLVVIAQESKMYNVTGENCWFYASTIQECLTEWCDGNLELPGAYSHQDFGKDARDRIRARRFDVMGVSGTA